MPDLAQASGGTQDYVGDPRNDFVLISVNGALTPRAEAKVSVFDSGFVLGDGVWEGLRLVDGRIAFLSRHLDRLWDGAKMLKIDIGLSRAALTRRLFDVIDANGMTDGVHIRLMVTRGVKRSPYQDPRLTIGAATIVIIPEWKQPRPEMFARGLNLFTVHIRRTGPAEQDQKLNSHSKLNCILACIQAMEAGADEALMLDDRGFVATCNSTHFFIVRKGEVWTSAGGYCLGGITRGAVLRAARREGIPAFEKDFSLFDVYGADEAFTTGTFAGLTPVVRVDGRAIDTASRDARRRLRPGDAPPRAAVKALEAEEAEGRTRMTGDSFVRIAMWSGPRNISTAMMRSFGARTDCAVTDEPFYAAYLVATGLIHPMRDEVIASQPTDWREVADALVGPAPDGKPIWYQKHMTHHMLPQFGREWSDRFVNAFLIRAPDAVLASYSHKRGRFHPRRDRPARRRRNCSIVPPTGSAARRRWSRARTCLPIRAAC